MPPDKDVNQQAAEKEVFDNLGLSAEELGVTQPDITEDDLDTGEQQEQPQRQEREEPRQQRDDLSRRVTHTEPQRQERQPFRNAPVKPDRQGNLRDAQGNIVAKAGKESRLYTDAHNARVEVQRARGEVTEINSRLEKAISIGQQLHSELEQFKAREEQIKGFGLESHEMLDAMNMAAMAKKDPQGALKMLLTRAGMAGIDLTQLGIQGGVDGKSIADALRQELASQLKPVHDQAQQTAQQRLQEQQDNEAKSAVEQEVRQFFTQNPEALQHGEVFQRVLQQFPRMTLGEVWARIQLNLMRSQQGGQQPNGRRPSLPNGRGGPQAGPQGRSDIAAPSTSYDDIIRAALNE